MDPRECKRVIVRAPNWLGDLVMANPIFARIRAGFAGAHITCAVRPGMSALLGAVDWFDEVLELPRGRGSGRIAAFWREVGAVRSGRYDLAIVLPNSPSTGWVVRLAGVRWRLGYRQGRPFTMNLGLTAERNRGVFGRRGPRRVPSPMPEYWGRLLDLIDLPPGPRDPVLAIRAADRQWVEDWLRQEGLDPDRPLALFSPGANYGPSKLWIAERWVELARHYTGQGMQAMFLAGPAELDLVRPMAAAAGCAWSCVGLDKLPALIARGRFLVSTDTGPRHLGVATRVPTVCLMGPNDSRYTDFALDRQIVLQKKDLPCVPCQRKVCPLRHHDCMATLEVAEVIAAVDQVVARCGASNSIPQ